VPTISLPSDPDLGQLRKQAKDLRRGVRSGDADALALAAQHHPDGGPEPAVRGQFPLSDAQLVVARAYGLTSWARLVHHVEQIRGLTRSPEPETSGDPADDFLRLACLTYDTDGPDRWAEARALLDAHPDLPAASIHAAAAAADARAVAAHLAGDRRGARREGGTFGWPPLLYLTYSRLDRAADEAAVLGVARLLLDAGADPDSGFLWHGLATPFTALTGAFGGGEGGIVDQPHHPHARSLARLLLDAGADPNDGQTLYNRMFEPDDSHLVLLFEHGLGQGDGGPWRVRLGDAWESPTELLRSQLSWAVTHDMADRVRLLIDHGVDVRSPFATRSFGIGPAQVGRTPLDLARLTGSTEVVDALVAAGIEAPQLDEVDALVAAVLAGDAVTAARLRQTDDGLLGRVAEARPVLVLDAVTTGRRSAVEVALALGFDVNATAGPGHGRSMGETALHEAAMNGEREIAEILLTAGADPNRRDTTHHGTPAAWAWHGTQPDLVALLEPLTAPDPGSSDT